MIRLWGLPLGNTSHRAHCRLGWVQEKVGRRTFHVATVKSGQVESTPVFVVERRSGPAFATIDVHSPELLQPASQTYEQNSSGSTRGGRTGIINRGKRGDRDKRSITTGKTGAAVVTADRHR